jgi:hypothetical protein
VGSRLCDYVPLKNCRLGKYNETAPVSWGTLDLTSLKATRRVCLEGALASSAVHHFGSALYSGSTLTSTLRKVRVSRMTASEVMLFIVCSTPCTSSALARLPSAEKVTWRTRLV